MESLSIIRRIESPFPPLLRSIARAFGVGESAIKKLKKSKDETK